MSRYRASAPKSSVYITPQGYARLRAELDERWAQRREVVNHLSAAAAEGDRSENAEYIYRKKQLRELDRRIRYLQKRIPEFNVVHRPANACNDKIYFGAYVTLEDEDGQHSSHRIVGGDETDPEKSWISIDSPMARALLGRSVNEEVRINRPMGETTMFILAISYDEEGGA